MGNLQADCCGADRPQYEVPDEAQRPHRRPPQKTPQPLPTVVGDSSQQETQTNAPALQDGVFQPNPIEVHVSSQGTAAVGVTPLSVAPTSCNRSNDVACHGEHAVAESSQQLDDSGKPIDDPLQESLGTWWNPPEVAAEDPLSNSLDGWWRDGQPRPDGRTCTTEEHLLDTSVRTPRDGPKAKDIRLADDEFAETKQRGGCWLDPSSPSSKKEDHVQDQLVTWYSPDDVIAARAKISLPMGNPKEDLETSQGSLGEWWADGKPLPDARTPTTRDYLLSSTPRGVIRDMHDD